MKRKSANRGLSICVVFLIFVILTFGCIPVKMMYEGEQPPREQTAIIKGSSKYLGFGIMSVFLVSVDGKPIERSSPLQLNVWVEVLPGQHTVQVVVWRDVMEFEKIKPYVLDFYALAGHTYRVRASTWETKNALVKIVDTNTGEIVASTPR